VLVARIQRREQQERRSMAAMGLATYQTADSDSLNAGQVNPLALASKIQAFAAV
jgi:hypothetical protein